MVAPRSRSASHSSLSSTASTCTCSAAAAPLRWPRSSSPSTAHSSNLFGLTAHRHRLGRRLSRRHHRHRIRDVRPVTRQLPARRRLDSQAPVLYPFYLVLPARTSCRRSPMPSHLVSADSSSASCAPRAPPAPSSQHRPLGSDSVDIVLTVPTPAICTAPAAPAAPTAPAALPTLPALPAPAAPAAPAAPSIPTVKRLSVARVSGPFHTPCITHRPEHNAVHAPQPGTRTRVTGHSRPVHTLCIAILAIAPQSQPLPRSPSHCTAALAAALATTALGYRTI